MAPLPSCYRCRRAHNHEIFSPDNRRHCSIAEALRAKRRHIAGLARRGRTCAAATVTPAIQALESAGIDFEILTYSHDPRSEAYGLEAATALALDARTVFKTLLVELEPPELATAIIPVTPRLNLKTVAKTLGAKRAHMAPPRAAERATGYVLGGISPFGQKKYLRTVLDTSALALDHLYVSAGRRGLEVRLAPTDLLALTHALTAAISSK